MLMSAITGITGRQYLQLVFSLPAFYMDILFRMLQLIPFDSSMAMIGKFLLRDTRRPLILVPSLPMRVKSFLLLFKLSEHGYSEFSAVLKLSSST